MGAWGTGPFDNDAASDMIASLQKFVDRVADAPCTPDPVPAIKKGEDYDAWRKENGLDVYYYYEEARAAVRILLLSHGTDILGGPGLVRPLRALARIRKDQQWIGTWSNPRKIAKALNEEIGAVMAKIGTCKGCRKSLSKQEQADLLLLAHDAIHAKVPKVMRRYMKRHEPRRRVRKAVFARRHGGQPKR
jgi:hypothetical protein